MYAPAPRSVARKIASHLMVLLGLAALILAAGLDTAEAALIAGPLDEAALMATTWLALAFLALISFVLYRRTVPSRARRAAIARRRPARTSRR